MLRKLGTSLYSLGRFSSKKGDLDLKQCSAATPVLRDFEYSDLIQNNLKESKPVQAYTVLLESHLNNVRLDIQTYSQLADGLVKAEADTSYLEVLYSLFREHFFPSLLMYITFEIRLTHMDHLRGRVSKQLAHKLEQDYQTLGQQSEIQQLREELPPKEVSSLDSEKSPRSSKQLAPAPQQKSQDSVVEEALNEALANAESIVLHDVVFNPRNFKKEETSQNMGDWLELHYRDQKKLPIKQKAVQHSEQVEFEMDLWKGFSIGKIEINRRKS